MSHAALQQDCVTVNYIVAGNLPGPHKLGEGLWTLEIPDHALGRLIQRTGNAAPVDHIMAAHHAVLGLRQSEIVPNNGRLDRDVSFGVAAGPGAFICHCSITPDQSMGGELQMHVFAHTWVADDQRSETQVVHIGDGGPGERLGDHWLLPMPMRRIVRVQVGDNDVATVVCWSPAVTGDGLDRPAGRA